MEQKCRGCNNILSEERQKDKRIKYCNNLCRKKYLAKEFMDNHVYDKCRCGNRKTISSRRCRKCHIKRGKGQLARSESSWKGEKGVFLI